MTNLYHYQRLFLFCCFSLMSSNIPAIAQPTVPEFQPEKIFIQTDRQLYITGEIIWFKLFVFDQLGDLSDFSKVAYVELIDGAGTALTQLKIGLENGQGNGAIELPPGLGSGRYQLRAYTQAMRNMGPEAFSYYSLILLHPEQPVVQAVSDQTGVELSGGRIGSSHNNDLKITVRPGREQLGQREKVRMEISSTDATGRPIAADISLAVALTAPGQNEFAIGTTAPLQPPTDIIFRPENKSLLLQGKVSRQSDGEAAHGQEIFLAFPGKTARVYTVATDANGHFSFLLPKMYGLQTVILQTGPEVSEPLRIELEDEFHEIIPTTPKAFTLPSAWLPVANASLINTQVQQAYRAFEKPPVFNTEQTFSEVPFFGRPDVQYRLDDYNRFALPEFFYEIVLEVQVRGKFGEQNISLVNRENHVFEDYPPLLLVDGVPVFDQRTFLKINNRLIASTEIVKNPFWLNPHFYNGIIQLTSFEGDARVFELPETALRRTFLTLLPQRQFTAPDHEARPDDSLPDFRNTLFWDPSIRTDEEGRANIEFFTSDALGNYTVEVLGVTETGLRGRVEQSIQVVKNSN